jgi:hypothetical protein
MRPDPDTPIKKREVKKQSKDPLEEKLGPSKNFSKADLSKLYQSLAPEDGYTLDPARRKFSLDLEYKEKERNSDLKNLLRTKLNSWLGQNQ